MGNLQIGVTFYNFELVGKYAKYYETTRDKIASDVKDVILKNYENLKVVPNIKDFIEIYSFVDVGGFRVKERFFSKELLSFDVELIEY